MIINDMLRNIQNIVDKLKLKVRFWDGFRFKYINNKIYLLFLSFYKKYMPLKILNQIIV